MVARKTLHELAPALSLSLSPVPGSFSTLQPHWTQVPGRYSVLCPVPTLPIQPAPHQGLELEESCPQVRKGANSSEGLRSWMGHDSGKSAIWGSLSGALSRCKQAGRPPSQLPPTPARQHERTSTPDPPWPQRAGEMGRSPEGPMVASEPSAGPSS